MTAHNDSAARPPPDRTTPVAPSSGIARRAADAVTEPLQSTLPLRAALVTAPVAPRASARPCLPWPPVRPAAPPTMTVPLPASPGAPSGETSCGGARCATTPAHAVTFARTRAEAPARGWSSAPTVRAPAVAWLLIVVVAALSGTVTALLVHGWVA